MEKRPRILVCDDEPLMTNSILDVLDTGDYQLISTNDSRHALTLIHAERPDLVLLDINMPGMDGFALMDAVDRERCDAAFVIVTGEASLESAVKAIRKGANDFIRKPFDTDDLVIRVENAMRQLKVNRDHMAVREKNHQLENQLQQAHKMEAIGTLAGGIAHDFNNVLSIILGNTELALADIPENQTARQNLDRILTATLRAREMVQQLLSFSRKEENSCQKVQLNTVIEESLKLMRASLPSNITIEKDIHPTLCTIVADNTKIHQVMLNLCTNASHAMANQGGVLTIRLEPVNIGPADAESIGLAPGSYARIVVADTGHGIPKDVLGRIFDPYFTTKETGKGTGMGLSVVHGIVKSTGGVIKAFSKPGRFTEFHIYLPCVDAVADAKPADIEQQHLPSGSEHILLVDDEDMLVDMMEQLLRQLGYTVSTHTNSEAALKSFLAAPAIYDLLITDMTMPTMTGIDLIKAAKAARDDLPAILCTGFNEQISEENAQSLGIQSLLMKPVGMQELAETIRKVLVPLTMERRQNPRFAALEGSFVISKAHPYERCSLVDIGRAGLAYRHEMDAPPANESDQLAIMTPDGEIFVNGIHCRTVSDLPAGSGAVLAEADHARRSVCFKNVTPPQMEQINTFIHAHTSGPLH
jgi:signal transduction histidine kinase